jgi:hypothetical protein
MRLSIAWAFFSCSVVLSALGQADVQATARSKITTLEQVWVRALAAGDLKSLEVLADPEMIYVDADGSLMTKGEVLSYAKSAHPQRVIKEFTKVQVFDDIVVVNGTYQSKEMKNSRAVVREGQFTDAWHYRDSIWVCIAAQITPTLTPAN